MSPINIEKPETWNLTGAEIITSLQKGHFVRRACWQDKVFIRICNERGYDKDGYAICDEHTAIYTLCTDGYFLHLAYSSQPFRKVRTFNHAGDIYVASRDGEGIGMLFASDWEDYGFISRPDFDLLTATLKQSIKDERQRLINTSKPE